MPTLVQYSYLQLLDLLTTIAFLIQGVQEGNPLVRMALRVAPGPLTGLVAIKVIAVILGVYCWRNAKLPLLRKVNVFFAVLVAWNLVVLIVRSVLPGGLS